MAGRKSTRILLIAVVGFFFFSDLLNAQADYRIHDSINLNRDYGITKAEVSGNLSNCVGRVPCSANKPLSRFQSDQEFKSTITEKGSEEGFGGIADNNLQQRISKLELDYSLRISYSHRLLRDAFLQNADIFLRSENDDQFLYSIDIKPSLIISDRIALNFIYSLIPEQENFSGSGVIDFEVQQTIVDNVNRFNGRAVSLSGAYAVPINEWIRVSMELGFTHMRLNTEEMVRYHPSDPYLRSFRVVRLVVSKKKATYTNPFIGLGTEFQLRNLRLGLDYQHQVYQMDQASSSNFTISLGVRFRDLF